MSALQPTIRIMHSSLTRPYSVTPMRGTIHMGQIALPTSRDGSLSNILRLCNEPTRGHNGCMTKMILLHHVANSVELKQQREVSSITMAKPSWLAHNKE